MSNRHTLTRRCAYLLLLALPIWQSAQVYTADQTPTGQGLTWDELAMTPAGSRMRLAFRDGSDAQGTLVAVHPDAVLVKDLRTGQSEVKGGTGSAQEGMTFQRSDIASVELMNLASRPRDKGPRASSFEQLGVLVRPGDTVTVTPTTGPRYSGKIASLSPTGLKLQVNGALWDVQERDVKTIRHRRGDSLANGALWGLGAGATVGMVACGTCHIGPGLMMAGLYGGLGAGIGVGIDALIRGNVVVYEGRGGSARRLTVAPMLAKSHKGVSVTVGF